MFFSIIDGKNVAIRYFQIKHVWWCETDYIFSFLEAKTPKNGLQLVFIYNLSFRISKKDWQICNVKFCNIFFPKNFSSDNIASFKIVPSQWEIYVFQG